MDRQFLVPATIAAAIHAGLLLVSPSSSSRNVCAVSTVPPVGEIMRQIFELTLEPPPPETESAVRQGSPEDAPPILPEPPPINTSATFEIKVPETPAHVKIVPEAKLPLGPVGILTGLPEGPPIGHGDIIGIWALDNTPRTKSQTPPVYPFEAKRNSLTGTVTVEFVVSETGQVLSPRVSESSDPIFNEAAVRAVARWRFEPGRKDGRVVRFRMAVPIVFTLNGE